MLVSNATNPSDGVAGEIDCIECDGTGVWTVLPPDNKVVKCTT
jgi:hypothetical protein